MTTKPLPYEEPRCWDEMCKCRHTCRRYLDRKDPAIRHCAILRPLWQCHDTPCANHIPREAPDADA